MITGKEMNKAWQDMWDSEAAMKKDAERYQFWRQRGIAISDSPVWYANGDELDEITDKFISEAHA